MVTLQKLACSSLYSLYDLVLLIRFDYFDDKSLFALWIDEYLASSLKAHVLCYLLRELEAQLASVFLYSLLE